MKKLVLVIGMSLLLFMACDEQAPEEGTPLSEIPIDGDGDINGDETADVGGGMNLGSGILDADGKLDGDFSDDGDDEWSGGINVDGDVNNDGTQDWGDGSSDWGAGLPKWSIGDKRTIKVDKNMSNGNEFLEIDYNDNLTSELDPARAIFMGTLFAKEAGNIDGRYPKDISVLIQSLSEPTGNTSDPSECSLYKQVWSGVDPNNDDYLNIESFQDTGSPFFLKMSGDDIVLSNLAIRVSLTIKYKFISPNTGNEEIINYVWKGSFTPQPGLHHELQLVGYSVYGKSVGDPNPYSSYVPI